MSTRIATTPVAEHRAASGVPSPAGPPARPVAERFGRNLAYVLTGFPVATASFSALITGLAVSAGLLVVWVGLPLMVFTLLVARLFATIERARLRARGDDLPPVAYRALDPQRSWAGRLIDRLKDPQAWLDVVHGLVAFPVALATWVVAVVWTSTALGGVTYWLWGRLVEPADPDDIETLAEVLDWGISDTVLYSLVGLLAAVSIVPVVLGMGALQAALARALLNNEHIGELQARVTDLAATRAAATEAESHARRRLERDIHDGPQQRLVRLGMDLATAERRLDDDPAEARRILAEARAHSMAALEELRTLSRGIAPPLLVDRGLPAALSDLGSRSSVPTVVSVELTSGARLPESVEQAVYFTVAESLTNVAKHAEATRTAVTVREVEGPPRRVVVEIVDDGVGGADLGRGHGLAGLRDRLGALDGTFSIESPPGGPTSILAEVPCGS